MRVVVVHSHPIVAKIMRLIVTDAGHDVVIAPTAMEGLQAVRYKETDATILEVDLPDMDGYRLCKELRATRYFGPIVFVSPRHLIEDKLRAFDHGADDYIVEPFEPAELLARVEAVARRCRHQDLQSLSTVIRVGDTELSIGDLTFRVDGEPAVNLTPTEMRLLERLMCNAGITIARDTLIERTWGYEFFGDSNRVDVYIARLRKKIEKDPSCPLYLHTVRGRGYVFRPPSVPTPLPHVIKGDIVDIGVHTYALDMGTAPA